jgi:hypothetical protein
MISLTVAFFEVQWLKSAATFQPHSHAAIPSQEVGFARTQLPEALWRC